MPGSVPDPFARTARRALPPILLALLVVVPLPAQAQAGSQDEGVVAVLGVDVQERNVTVRVTTYWGQGQIRNAGLYLDGALVSTESGGWVSYSGTTLLRFRLQGDYRQVELRLLVERVSGSNTTLHRESTQLRLDGHPDVRPVDATVSGRTVQVTLANLGNRTARGVLVSLQDATGAAAAVPYVQRLPDLRGGQVADLPFTLSRSGDRATVVVESAGVRTTYPILFRSAGGGMAGLVEVAAGLTSVDVSPGGTASYDLRLTNGGGEAAYTLAAEGLPDGYTATFSVQGTRVQGLTLGAGEAKAVTLGITVPQGAAGANIDLRATVLDNGTKVGERALRLTVGGAPFLELAGRNWFLTTDGDTATTTITVRNSGSAPAHDVRVVASPPPGWDVAIDPDPLPTLAAGASAEVTLVLKASGSTSPGRYVTDLSAVGTGIASRERSLTVEVEEASSSALPWVLGAAVACAAVLALLLRIRRR